MCVCVRVHDHCQWLWAARKKWQGNICCWELLHHHQIIFIKQLLCGWCGGLAGSHEMKTGLFFSSFPCIQPPTLLPLYQILTEGFCFCFCPESWTASVLKEKSAMVTEGWLCILMKLHSSSERTQIQVHLGLGLEPTISDLRGVLNSLYFFWLCQVLLQHAGSLTSVVASGI